MDVPQEKDDSADFDARVSGPRPFGNQRSGRKFCKLGERGFYGNCSPSYQWVRVEVGRIYLLRVRRLGDNRAFWNKFVIDARSTGRDNAGQEVGRTETKGLVHHRFEEWDMGERVGAERPRGVGKDPVEFCTQLRVVSRLGSQKVKRESYRD